MPLSKHWKNWRRGRVTWAAGLIAVSGIVAWALFWPDSSCSEPACARRRFAVAVELDAFKQVDPIEFAVSVGHERVSLRSIFASGGVDAQVMQDQTDLPYKAASGALDRADLYQFATAWRNSESRRESCWRKTGLPKRSLRRQLAKQQTPLLKSRCFAMRLN